jgi:hypothetical protein
MDIGSGIAVCGVWFFAGACALSKTLGGEWFAVGLIVAIATTAVLV